MHAVTINHPNAPDGGTEQEILRVLRQIYLLLEQGREQEATRVQTVRLDPLIAAHREARGAGSLSDERLGELYAEERKRVSEAALLCSLLAPLLAEHLRRPAGPHRDPEPIMFPTASTGVETASRRPAGIADFIDDMITQDHATRPPRAPRSRSDRRRSGGRRKALSP